MPCGRTQKPSLSRTWEKGELGIYHSFCSDIQEKNKLNSEKIVIYETKYRLSCT